MAEPVNRSKVVIPGYRKGKLLVIEATDQRKDHRILWRCRCDCGNEILLDTNNYAQELFRIAAARADSMGMRET